jgi:uncharacterized repeat protein (TIGR03803 family)
MKRYKGVRTPDAAFLVVVVVTLVLAPSARAQGTFKTLHTFTGGKDGGSLQSGLAFDQEGNLYGTTASGGTDALGTVFELSQGTNGKWARKVLHNFGSGDDGRGPVSSVIFDGARNLYGTTNLGGDLTCNYPDGCGVVFELMPNSNGSWKEKVLYRFKGGADGGYPYAGLIFDQAGDLYGTTRQAGPFNGGYGVVFELIPHAGGRWTEKVLYSFMGGTDGSNPSTSLTFDHAGNLYGSTIGEGAHGSGAIFKLHPNANRSWTESTLYSFCSLTNCSDGGSPYAALIFDGAGDLYGTTLVGGIGGGFGGGYGVVFELKPHSNGSWTEKVLHSFTGGTDGGNSYAPVIFDGAGNLYGTATNGGDLKNCTSQFNYVGCGVVLKLTPNSNDRWHESVLHTFTDLPGNGAHPYAGLIFDGVGNLYSTTDGDGTTTYGSVFEITP